MSARTGTALWAPWRKHWPTIADPAKWTATASGMSAPTDAPLRFFYFDIDLSSSRTGWLSAAREHLFLEGHEYLSEIGDPEQAEDFDLVDRKTVDDAREVLELVRYRDAPPPMILSHGGDAVVFHWEDDSFSRYLTISHGRLRFLVVDRISRMQCRYSPLNLADAIGGSAIDAFASPARFPARAADANTSD